MSMIPEQYIEYIKREDSFEPGTNGLDCSCGQDVKPSLIGTETDRYYQNRIDVLVQGSNRNVNQFNPSLSFGTHLTINQWLLGSVVVVSMLY